MCRNTRLSTHEYSQAYEVKFWQQLRAVCGVGDLKPVLNWVWVHMIYKLKKDVRA